MGRAEILENKGEGRYRCQYKFGTALIEQQQKKLAEDVVELNKGIVKLTDEIAALTVQFDALMDQLRAIINEPGPMIEDKKKRMSAKLAELSAVGIQLKEKEAAKEQSKAQKDAAVEKSLQLSALPESEERELWMADYSTEIKPDGTDIPTIEIAGETYENNPVVLFPAKKEPPIAFDEVIHGERQHALAISAAGCFAAWSMFPGWQKYRPGYRVGKILKIVDGNYAKVELQVPLISSEQNLPIPPSDPMVGNEVFERQTHERVPFRYMDCDSIAFKKDDEVVIEYEQHDSKKPVIIGFAHDPEPCAAINVYTSDGERLRYAPRKPGAWKSVTNSTVPRFGGCYWVGDGGAVSWHGWRARYFAARLSFFVPQPPDADEDFTSTSLYYRGRDYGPCPGIVLGGCVRKGVLFAVCRVGEQEVIYSRALGGDPIWTAIASVDATTWGTLAPWYFSQSGLKAASAKTLGGATQLVELLRTGDGGKPPFQAGFHVRPKVPFRTVIPPPLPGSESGSGTITTEHDFAVDYVGEDLVTLDRREETRQAFAGSTGNVGLFTVTVACPALSVEYLHFNRYDHVTIDATIARYTVATPQQIDHLNITGGTGKIVSVTRRIDVVQLDTGGGTDPVSVITASERARVTSGVDSLIFAPVTETATLDLSTDNKEFLRLQSLLFPYASTSPLAYSVVTRTGHLVTSLPLVMRACSIPPLPEDSRLRLYGGSPIGAG